MGEKLFSHTEGGIQTQDFCEWGVEENIRALEGRGDRGVEKTA
jgi:hypothetical protein